MISIEKNKDLELLNTFGLNVNAAFYATYETMDDLCEIFSHPVPGSGQWLVMGGGSNIVFTKDFAGMILHPAGNLIEKIKETEQQVWLKVQAGTDWDEFVGYCSENGYWGAENLSYIPGTVGASPVQNIGAYGTEAKDIIESVTMFCVDNGKTLTLAADHCDFGYRDSIFKRILKGKVVITEVIFKLSKIERPLLMYGDLRDRVEGLGGTSLQNIRRAVTEIRRSKLPEPKEIGNAGSFFKNPVINTAKALELKEMYPEMPLYPTTDSANSKLAAGWLIDKAGWKGYREGAVGVHERQALVLVNYGGAAGSDVIRLARKIQADISEKFGVEIETEVNII